MRKARVLVLTLFVATLCVGAEIDKSELSEDISYATFGDRGKRVKIVVGSLPAQLKNSDDFIAFQLAVGTATGGPELVFNYNHFALLDASGKQFDPAKPMDVAADSGYWRSVESLRTRRPLETGAYFGGYLFVVSNFYNKDGVMWGGTHLDNGNFFRDVIFFPKPDDPSGVLTLAVFTQGMDEPVEVKFDIPKFNKNPVHCSCRNTDNVFSSHVVPWSNIVRLV